jgi:undecaprenyl-diphosphatase
VDIFYHYLQVIVLGIVEGVTEFLPISSTGHLLIAEHLMGTQEPDIFNVVIQAGAILAVVFIYWHKIVAMLTNLDHPDARGYLIKIGTAFVVTTVAYLVIAKLIGHHKLTESLANVAWATLIGGFVIFAIEYLAKNLYAHEDVSWFEAVLVGLAQVVAAIFPGASRSGSTIMAGLAVGMKRPVVTEFSFLVGIPTMFAASVFAVYKGREDLHGIDGQLIVDTVIGFLVSMVVAFFVVKWLLRFVVSHTFNGFGFYRVVLGTVLLIGLYTHAIPDVTNEKPKDVSVVVPTVPVVPAPTAEVTPPTPAPVIPDQTNAMAPVDSSTNSPSPFPSSAPDSATNSSPANVPAPQN